MSSEALQRTVRRVGAVLVLAVGALTMGFFEYVSYQGISVDVWESLTLLLVGGAFVYLVGSVLVGTAATTRGQVERERAASQQRADDGEEPVDGSG